MASINQDLQYRVFVDEVSPTLIYVGYSERGTEETALDWVIYKIETTTSDCVIVMSPNVRGGTGSSAAITTLNQAYNNGAEPEIQLNSTRGALTLADNATPLVGNLFEIENSGLTVEYFAVSRSKTKVSNKLIVSTSTRGTSTLVAGTVTVSNTSVSTGDLILMSATNQSGTAGHLSYSIVNGTSFTITSTSNTDTRTIHWLIIGQ